MVPTAEYNAAKALLLVFLSIVRRLAVIFLGDDLVLLPGLLVDFFRELGFDFVTADLGGNGGRIGVDKADRDCGDTGECSDSVS